MQRLILWLWTVPVKWPFLHSWRAKLYTGIVMMACIALYPIYSIICGPNLLQTLLWSPFPFLLGWCSGRLIGEAALQRGAERAAEYLKRREKKHE